MSLIKYICALVCIVVWFILCEFISTSYVCNTDNEIKYTGIREGRVTKTILLWNSFFKWPDYFFGFGRKPFILHDCEYSDCLLTNDRHWSSLEEFDAIVFHGPQFLPASERDFPAPRSAHQLYVYYSQESPDTFSPGGNHDGVFNLTVCYRLDADVPKPYFSFTDLEGNAVAPAWNPLWERPTVDRKKLRKFDKIHKRKTKPVAWFVSKCSTANNRFELVSELQKYVNVDIYGHCGPLKCSNKTECFELLKRDYYFYLSFENSNCVDYVTEKVYTGFKNDLVPIVFNGVDMKRFAPPGSYINAGEMTPSALSDRIKFLMNNSAEYSKYFWWKNHYRVIPGGVVNPFCNLCKILHDKQRKEKSYSRFVDWFRGSPGNPFCKRGLRTFKASLV